MLGLPKVKTSSARTARVVDDVGARYGFRRVEQVRVAITNGGAQASVAGVVHRYPRVVRVPLHVAAELIAAGAPSRIES